MMGAANTARGEAQIQLLFQTTDNQILPQVFARKFLNFRHDLPDYMGAVTNGFAMSGLVNEDYLRESADYWSCWERAIFARLVLTNQSHYSLGDTHLEVMCRCPDGQWVSLLRADDMPNEPEPSGFGHYANIPTVLDRATRQVRVDETGTEPIAHITLGGIRPGQTIRVAEALAILPSGPGSYSLRVRILANEIPAPQLFEHPFDVAGPVTDAGESELSALMSLEARESEGKG